MASKLNLLAALRGTGDDEYQRQREDSNILPEEIEDVVKGLYEDFKKSRPIRASMSNTNLLSMPLSKFAPNKISSQRDKNSQFNDNVDDYMADEASVSDERSNDLTFDRAKNINLSTASSFVQNRRMIGNQD